MSWNIGNTTVRNPRRIRSGLRVVATGFNGNLSGSALESIYAHRLVAEGIIDTGKEVDAKMDWHGRKWRSCFTKLGFLTGNNYHQVNGNRVLLSDLHDKGLGLTSKPYEVTPAGLRLLDANSESAISDVFLRQLLRLEITSPTEQESDSVRVKPFVLLLQMLKALEDKGFPGLNRSEIATFMQTATNHDNYKKRVQGIIDYRNQREQCIGEVKKRQFDLEIIKNELKKAGFNTLVNTLIDYADTTFRYCRMSGLLSLQGSRIKIREETSLLVDEILKTEPTFLASIDPIEYLIDFYKGTKIPTDDIPTALKEIGVFETKLVAHGVEPVLKSLDLIGKASQDLAIAKNDLETQYLLVLENEFAKSHAENIEIIDEVVNYLKKLNKVKGIDVQIDDEPSYLEWSVWRALLLFNNLSVTSDKTRNFNLDADLRPVACAPSGKPDIIMDYKDFITVAEVTMKSGSRQEAAEGEPVRRHVAKVRQARQDKEVYCLFVAPSIDDNTAETFRYGIWYDDHSPIFLNVVPLSLNQFIKIIESLKIRRKTSGELKAMLGRCLMFRNAYAPQWLQHIETEINDWIVKN